jgi:hypothetical protein
MLHRAEKNEFEKNAVDFPTAWLQPNEETEDDGGKVNSKKKQGKKSGFQQPSKNQPADPGPNGAAAALGDGKVPVEAGGINSPRRRTSKFCTVM